MSILDVFWGKNSPFFTKTALKDTTFFGYVGVFLTLFFPPTCFFYKKALFLALSMPFSWDRKPPKCFFSPILVPKLSFSASEIWSNQIKPLPLHRFSGV